MNTIAELEAKVEVLSKVESADMTYDIKLSKKNEPYGVEYTTPDTPAYRVYENAIAKRETIKHVLFDVNKSKSGKVSSFASKKD